MKTHTGTVQRVSNRFGFRSITVTTGYSIVYEPGQYILASSDPAKNDPVPSVLFIENVNGNDVSICSPAPVTWIPGLQISFRGPLGHGFRLPKLLRRMALIGLDNHPGRLMPLVQAGMRMKADLVIGGDFTSDPVITQDIPPLVELAGLNQWTELLGWADFVAMDVPLEKMQNLSNMVGDIVSKKVNRDIQILVHTSMPCGGIAECGICAVRTKRGYKLACKDGPVFDLADLSLT